MTDAKFIERIHELKHVPRLNETESLVQLLRRAIDLLLPSATERESIDFVLYAHSVLAQAPYHSAWLPELLEDAGLGRAPYWGVSQLNCASGLAGADLATRLLKRRPLKRVLLLTGDATTGIPEARYILKSTVMGDSASATLIEAGSTYEFLCFSWLRDNRFSDGFYATSDEQSKFGEVYQDHLFEVVRQACAKAGMSLNEIDWIVPHNVNMTTWRRFSRNTGFPKSRIFTELLSDVGHSYCNDGFLNLHEMQSRNLIRSGQHLLLTSVGVGSYFGAAVLRKNDREGT